jgi:putative ABC transport system ATP-binding protein
MIDLRNITKVFNKDRHNEFVALNDVTLNLNKSRVIVFKGPSGSGKTTLLSIIGCMTRPSTGRVFVLDEEISSLPERFMADIRRRTFGFIFQQLNLLRGITALENVMLPGYPTGEKYGVLREKALDLFEMLNLGQKSDSKVEWLSGGEAQRVAIARALINDPAIVVADEPTAHLDTKLSIDFMDIMEKLKNSGKIILFASHDPLVYTSRIVECIIEMRDGFILEQRAKG